MLFLQNCRAIQVHLFLDFSSSKGFSEKSKISNISTKIPLVRKFFIPAHHPSRRAGEVDWIIDPLSGQFSAIQEYF